MLHVGLPSGLWHRHANVPIWLRPCTAIVSKHRADSWKEQSGTQAVLVAATMASPTGSYKTFGVCANKKGTPNKLKFWSLEFIKLRPSQELLDKFQVPQQAFSLEESVFRFVLAREEDHVSWQRVLRCVASNFWRYGPHLE